MTRDLALRPTSSNEVEALACIQDAQDTAWWGAPDGDVDDQRAELDNVRLAVGSLEAGARVAVVPANGTQAETLVGFALVLGHGHSNLAVDPTSSRADEALRLLVAWLVSVGTNTIDTPAQDRARGTLLATLGWRATRSSFELERHADLVDLGPTEWPTGGPTRWPYGIAPAAFRRGTDDAEVHEAIYSVWTDVEGHTGRSLPEWQRLLLHDAPGAGDLVVVARRDGGRGPVAGVAVCRTFAGGVGWVSQLAVCRPHRGLGLGRSLLIESFRRLAAAGAETLALGVEARNEKALGLYRSVGLEVAREWLHYSPQCSAVGSGPPHPL